MKSKFYKFIIAAFLLTFVVACQDDESMPESSLELHPWDGSSMMDKSYKPGDDFYKYANGAWLKENADKIDMTSSRPKRYDYFNIIGEQINQSLETLTTTSSPNRMVASMASQILNNQSITPEFLNFLEKEMKEVYDIQTEEDAYQVMGILFSKGYETNLTYYIDSDNQKDQFIPLLDFSVCNFSSFNDKSEDFIEEYEKWVKFCLNNFAHTSSDDADLASNNIANLLKEIYTIKNYQSYKYGDNPANYTKRLMSRAADSRIDIFINAFNKGAEMKLSSDNFTYNSLILIDRLRSKGVGFMKLFLMNAVIQKYAILMPEEVRNLFPILFSKASLNNSLQNILSCYSDAFLSRLYSEGTKDENLLSYARNLTDNIKNSFRKRLENNEWMGSATKNRALAKLDAIIPIVGYPDSWDDVYQYPEFMSSNNLYDNVLTIMKSVVKLKNSFIGSTLEQKPWYYLLNKSNILTNVNAFYSPAYNTIYIPWSIIHFLDINKSDAWNYGSFGTVIGHELTHGFDTMGSQYDLYGDVNNWWAIDDRLNFNERSQKLIDEFDAGVLFDDYHCDGEKTVTENQADLGGVRIAYDAFMEKKKMEGMNGTTLEDEEKNFFIRYAQLWRSVENKAFITFITENDEHSSNCFRVNFCLNNIERWYELFDVKKGNELYLSPEYRTILW